MKKLDEANADLTTQNLFATELYNKSFLINEEINNISKNLEEALKNDVPVDLLEIDIKEICEILGEIIGENYNDKLIYTLFSNFCLGK